VDKGALRLNVRGLRRYIFAAALTLAFAAGMALAIDAGDDRAAPGEERSYRAVPAPAQTGTFVFVYTSRVDGLAPSVWTGDNVRVNFGHSPLQRVPTFPSLPVGTNGTANATATQNLIRLRIGTQ